MSEGLGEEVKTNPQGDVITAAPAPRKRRRRSGGAESRRSRLSVLQAPREKTFITGSEAAKEAIRRANVDVAISYPITPQSETMQQVGYLYAEGYVKDYYRGEEEYGVMSAIAGASRSGVRCLSATAGPGLMRGLEVISSWPGGRLPAVLLIMCRVINAPLAIQPDNVELSYMLNTGCLLFHAENQQDFYDYALAAFMIGEKPEVTLPSRWRWMVSSSRMRAAGCRFRRQISSFPLGIVIMKRCR